MAHEPNCSITLPHGGLKSVVRIARTRRSDLVEEVCRHGPGQLLPGAICVLPAYWSIEVICPAQGATSFTHTSGADNWNNHDQAHGNRGEAGPWAFYRSPWVWVDTKTSRGR